MNMHVPLPYGVQSAELTDEAIERGKAANRGLVAEQLARIVRVCERFEDDDPRYLEIHLRAIDRFARLARVFEAEVSSDKRSGDLDRGRLVSKALADLDALEAKVRGD